MWNVRRGGQPLVQQFRIMTKEQPSAENLVTDKQRYDEPRGGPIDTPSDTEELPLLH